MDTLTVVLLVAMGLLLVLYMARRRGRLNQED
jgi:hypothetical protein